MVFNYKIEILTPTVILSGDKIKSFEIIKDGNKAFVVDFDRLIRNEENFMNFVINYPEILGDRNNFLNTLKRLNINYKNYIKNEIKGYIKGNTEVSEFVKTAGRPYIPGSSLKGAIRTFLIKGTQFQGEYEKKFQYLLESKKDNKKDIKKLVKNIDLKVFGKAVMSPFKLLKVSDSNYLEYNDLKITNIQVYHLLKNKTVLDLYAEYLDSGKVLNGTIKIDDFEKYGNMDFILRHYYKDPRLIFNDFVKNINLGVKRYIEKEKEIVTEQGIEDLKRSYNMLEDKLNNLNENQFLLQLGFSTGFYSKTIFVKNLEAKQVRFLKSILGKRKKNYKPEFFPLTRRVVKKDGVMQPLGWIMVTLTKK
ncbi:type III-A CRISPR-associated RAMP protein Csm5 [Thermosipho sp. 1074]|uniref:type III-A CRISPR-associated RAMP protein Csm5 n=1 Tax=Thermosipho sp. 1074 TaxID=1643331 RepID=UPI000984AE4D|nr:type III-A CRISPR-associated RAMP protein Csm5 [Thermosipho sp. 1074]OOC45560.1 hypothetical protein XO08_00580 [Thermosipho sp. 1074]